MKGERQKVYVFQYGSNMSEERINHWSRLDGKAKFVDVAETLCDYYVDFNVSPIGSVLTLNMIHDVRKYDSKVVGILYEVPVSNVFYELEKGFTKSLDTIEGDLNGMFYNRYVVPVITSKGELVVALTYVAISNKAIRSKDYIRKKKIRPRYEYCCYIMDGLIEHNVDEKYIEYMYSIISSYMPKFKEIYQKESGKKK